MQPNKPQAPAPNPYDFITNPAKPPKKSLFGGSGSLTKRVVIIVGGAVGLMIVLAIATTLLTSGKSGSTSAMKSLVAQQQELARIAAIGADKAQDSTIRSRALTAKLSVTTQQKKLINHLEEQNVKLSEEELAGQKDGSIDKELNTAASSNRFDEAFNEELMEQLTRYATALQDAYDSTSNEEAKAVLSDSFKSTAYILDLE